MSNYKRKDVFDYLTRKPVTTQDIELARTRIQTPVTPLPMQVASGEERVLNKQPFYQEPKELVQDDSPSPQVDSIPLYQGVQPGVAIEERMPIYLPPNMAPVMPQIPGIPDPQFRQIELAEGGRAEFASGSLPNKEQQQRIKEMYSDSLPRGTKFDFKKYPLTGVSLQGNEKLYKNISNNLYRPGYILSGEKQNVIKSQQRKEKLKEYLKNEVNKFENEKILPNEKYKINKEQLRRDFKVDHPIINNVLNDLKKEGKYNFIIPKLGENTATSLPQEIVDSYKKNYNKKTVAQIASEITGKSYDNKETKNVYGQLNKLQKTLIKNNLINPKDVATGSVGEPITNTKSAYDKYAKAQQRLMQLDPKTYGEFKNPASLDRELKRRLRFNEISGSLDLDLPRDLKPSYEHIQGITPSHIIQDPEGLSKVGIQTRRYNFNIMGRETMNSPYKIVQNYLSTARRSLNLNDIETAKDALNEVNTIYDEVSDSYTGIKRKELPFYNIKNDRVVESNVKGVIKPQTLQKGFEQYFKNTAAVIKPEELNQLKNIQPNVANILTLYKKGEDIEASKLIKTRIPDIKKGELFMNVVPGQQSMIDFVQGIGSDIKAGKILSPFMKVLGAAAIPLTVYDTYEGYTEGLPLDETLLKGLLGAEGISQTFKEQAALSPKAREAKQVLSSNTDLGMDSMGGMGYIQAPSTMTEQEAKKIYLPEAEAYAKKIEQENLARAQERNKYIDYAKERFSPFSKEAPIEMASGGRAKFASGSDDPESDLYIPPLDEKEISGTNISKEGKEGIDGLYFRTREEQRPIPVDPMTGKPISSGGIRELKQVFSSLLSDTRPEAGYRKGNIDFYASKGINPFQGDTDFKYGASYTPEGNVGKFMIDKTPQYLGAGYNYQKDGLDFGITGLKDERGDKSIALRFGYNYAIGGRVGFKDGPEDPTKRKFIKGAGVVGALGVAAKYAPDLFTAAKKAVPKIVKAAKVIEGAPEWFSNFLSKVVNEKTFLFEGVQYEGGRKAKIHNYVDPVSGKKVGAIDDGNSIDFQFETDAGMPGRITYIKPSTKIDPKTGEKIELPGLYEEYELVYRGQGDDYTKDVVEEIISGKEGIAKIGAPGKISKTDKAKYDFDEAEGQALSEIDRMKDEGLFDD